MSMSTLSVANDVNVELNKLPDTVQDAEGNTYRTVQIGEQIWLAENLRATQFQDGTTVATGAIPKDKPENLLKYGRLYNWQDVADSRNICPVGWRVATDEDWQQLEKTIGMAEAELDNTGWRGQNGIGHTLKEVQAEGPFNKIDQSLVNKHQFFARAAGVKWRSWYITQGWYTEFWTASETSSEKAINRTLAHQWWNMQKGKNYRSSLSKDYLFSVRCVKE